MTRMIRIFDTTLRDGEQSPGASMNVEEKSHGGEATGSSWGSISSRQGLPIARLGDFEAVRRIAQEVEGPTICSLARARPEDIDRAWEALQGGSESPHSYVSLDFGYPLEAPVPNDTRRGEEARGRDGATGEGLCGRCGIFAHGCQSFRSDLSL